MSEFRFKSCDQLLSLNVAIFLMLLHRQEYQITPHSSFMFTEHHERFRQQLEILLITGNNKRMVDFKPHRLNWPLPLFLILGPLQGGIALQHHVDSQRDLIDEFQHDIDVTDKAEFSVCEWGELRAEEHAGPTDDEYGRHQESEVGYSFVVVYVHCGLVMLLDGWFLIKIKLFL